ncbi:uncharacterized protein LOC134789808 isoform X1 [Cydia splendana]|uniref:uncharacterized protein LOC134789808 isoform X1 n=1 Tax=Cydia splendana TaxID=1100963 RepID=UPI0021206E60
MPLTQEKRLDNNFTNNNDHSYLHKKFKKMASTIAVFPVNNAMVGDPRHKDIVVEETARNSYITNGSIQAAHPEIEKIKGSQNNQNSKDVQINISDEKNSRLCDVNNFDQVSGKTSCNDEFSNKTENLENDFRDVQSGGTGGRYVCPYCKLSCAKPSVLQKHIRAHTNERPYPCVPCGFAFKTKSNLYKHRRSRTHALRLRGADVAATINDDDISGGSESDTSLPPSTVSDSGTDVSNTRLENSRPYEISSPELTNDRITPPSGVDMREGDTSKLKTIYKPKFRVVSSYQEIEEKDKLKKTMSPNADFLTEHISKIISNNEAIVDVIETPLQKKYGKIKQIAESKQFMNEHEIKTEPSPLNLTKHSNEIDNVFRKRSHSESFSQSDHQKHPLNPEGSIIKDLLLKTKGNGLISVTEEINDGPALLYICPLCQIVYKSAENLEIHRLYYCKGNFSNSLINNAQKELKTGRPENVYVRSNSVNVRLPETPSNSSPKMTVFNNSPPLKIKPDNLVIVKPESNDVAAPLPSPGPLLGNTRLVDARVPYDYNKKTENVKVKPMVASPKRRMDSSSDPYGTRISDNTSPRLSDLYNQSKIRCIEASAATLRTMDELSQLGRHNSTSLQMFGGEVKIVHHSGSTTTLRIEPSKNQLSPVLIHPNLSPSKLCVDMEASSVVVRSELHSGGTIVHNPPTPKEMIGTPKPQTPRIAVSTNVSSNLPNIHDITHFQFPPFSAITAYNPLTLPPLSPSTSPNGATTILHGGKLIPHVPGIPGPTTPGTNVATLSKNANDYFSPLETSKLSTVDNVHGSLLCVNGQAAKGIASSKYEINKNETMLGMRSPNCRPLNPEADKVTPKQYNADASQYVVSVPIINIRNVDEPNVAPKIITNIKNMPTKQDVAVKRNFEGVPKTPMMNSNFLSVKPKYSDKLNSPRSGEIKSQIEIRNFNFESLITKAEIFNNQIPSSAEVQKNTNAQEMVVSSAHNERSETAYFQKNVTTKSIAEDRKPKFLRPSTLPLKPGTFTPKRHHGITPNANTMPLVSPETPRPAKAYGQLYLNGNAYTYLGLKCSTKVFYCTINRPQPTYVPNQHFLSMYSNWQLLSELTPDPLGLSASSAMSLYDSRHRPQNVASSVLKQDLILTHSSQWNKITKDSKQSSLVLDSKKTEDKLLITESSITPKKELAGGFESNEEYTYVRGRGRGRYVCSECGIRCKKPSMLKKHIRTHTDVRPYTCVHCAFSFKTKGNLTKHMKSKAHFKKCCELGINPNEGNDVDGGEMAPGSGETDDDSDSDGDEGNEGETESSDTEVCKSRLPEHEAAHCLLSLGGSRPATSATPGLITSARPSTYPYTPTGLESTTTELSPENFSISRSTSVDSRTDVDNEPMDLSKNDVKVASNIPEIPTARESSVLASLASNTAKLPHNQTHWSNGEPMLHTYLTERALQDSKIKQSQLTSSLSKLKKIELEKNVLTESDNGNINIRNITTPKNSVNTSIPSPQITISTPKLSIVGDNDSSTNSPNVLKEDNITVSTDSTSLNNLVIEAKRTRTPSSSNAENAKHVVSEYLKHARINLIKSYDDNNQNQPDVNDFTNAKGSLEDRDEINNTDDIKLPALDHDPIARKVVIGAGGVAFKVTKGKEFEGSSSYSPGRLMEDGRRVCDFCNKTFTKPSQLRLHLNIHYMERPFRCSACAVSFRTRGHLQKHERSGSHHNKVSMTSTFGAATSLNPRPFRCSDCNIAFRIHGHLAKHLRSKMHVMRLECLFKLPFGTFTEIERAGVSLTDIDTTDCASSLASLQTLARKLHEKDPSKLEYREPGAAAASHDGSEDEEPPPPPADNACDSERDSEMKTIEHSDELDKERS